MPRRPPDKRSPSRRESSRESSRDSARESARESARRRIAIITAAFLAVIVALGAVAALPTGGGSSDQKQRHRAADGSSQQRNGEPGSRGGQRGDGDTRGGTNGGGQDRGGQDRGGNPLAHLAHREQGDPMALGPVDAPVVIVEYAEFQCPYCRQFAEQTQPKIVQDYVKTGKVRLEWRDFPYLGQESKIAARAGRAAARQGKFWQYHDALFAQDHELNSGTFTKDFLVDQAAKLGLDTDRFARDMEAPKVKQAVQADFQEGSSLGVTGTPAFVIGTTPMLGARPYSDFADAIDAELKAAR